MQPVLAILLSLFCCSCLCTDPNLYWHSYHTFGDVPTEPQGGGFGMVNSTHGVYFGGYDDAPCFNPSCPSVMSDKTHILTQQNSTPMRWTRVTPTLSPSPRAVFSGYCTMKETGLLYQFGGVDINTFQTNPELWVYNITSNTWTKLSNIGPGSRIVGFMSCVDGEVWIFNGGFIDINTFDFFTVNDVWVYSVHRRTWTQKAPSDPTPDNLPDDSTPPHQRYNNVGDFADNKFVQAFGDELDSLDQTVLNGVFSAVSRTHGIHHEFLGHATNRTLTFMRCDGRFCFVPFGDFSDGGLHCLAGSGNNDNPTNQTVVVDARRGTVSIVPVTQPSPALKSHSGDLWQKADGSTHIIVGNGYTVGCLNSTAFQFSYNRMIYVLPSGLY